MKNKIILNEEYYLDTLSKIKIDGSSKLHILADFDKTLTKAFYGGKIRPSLISVLRSEGYLGEEYSKKAYELYNYYHAIEVSLDISLEEKKKEMNNWWNKHLKLLVESKLHKSDIDKVIKSGIIELKLGVKQFLSFLYKHNIPIIIMSASGLGKDSIEMYLLKEKLFTPNIKIISNEFIWDEKGNVLSYDKRVIHSFNKDETALLDFPEIYNLIENRPNVVLFGDSLGDPHMVDGFDYNNLLKIGFLNENFDELIEKYREKYDVVLVGDEHLDFFEKLVMGIVSI